ncbi:diguanylate cyclase [Hylemonella sp. W303a]|uniref:GGDEF domain-containing protein n=1 Tax=Hylemonella sp. W303a TaxID=3389873 RepID=UPI00396B17AF
MSEKTPFEIARETLKQITLRKLPPTPVNYQAIYHAVAGLPQVELFPEEHLRRIAQALPARNPGQEKQLGLLDYAISQRNWLGVQNALLGYSGFAVPSGVPHPAAPEPVAADVPSMVPELLEQIARLIEFAQPAFGGEDTRFHERMQQTLQALRDPATSVIRVRSLLADFNHRLSFAAEEQAEIRLALFKLLQLIIKNIGELSPDDAWLQGQIKALQAAAQPPLTLRRLDEVEHQLKDVIFKQTEAKGRAIEAQESLRQMLAAFITRLSQVTASSSDYQEKMEDSLRDLEQAKNLEDIGPVLRGLIRATRDMRLETVNVGEELQSMRAQVQAKEAELRKLQAELERLSAQVRHDGLTGALNRQGLDEAFVRELSTVRRKDAPLCVALLDIDNFKRLNDARGHETGDVALQHLVAVAKENLRPQDTLARYGGEEFVILLPETGLESAMEVMIRLQRELSKRFFLARPKQGVKTENAVEAVGGDQEKIFITFSAGVAQLTVDETAEQALHRADQAMYLAKRAGKNRVVAA